MRLFWMYYGGKWRLTPRYPAPVHDTIVEPFAGAAGYSVRHHQGRRIILCDIDDNIVMTWRYLIRATEREIMALPDIASGTTVGDYGLTQEQRIFVGWWIRSWEIHHCDFSELDLNVLATWFVDPTYSTPAGQLYRHRVADFAALGSWCRSRPGQVIVCEQEGAGWLPFRPLHSAKTARAKKSAEVVWVNG